MRNLSYMPAERYIVGGYEATFLDISNWHFTFFILLWWCLIITEFYGVYAYQMCSTNSEFLYIFHVVFDLHAKTSWYFTSILHFTITRKTINKVSGFSFWGGRYSIDLQMNFAFTTQLLIWITLQLFVV